MSALSELSPPVTPAEVVAAVAATPGMAHYGGVVVEDAHSEILGPVKRVKIITGGYSRNEALVGELMETIFHVAWWSSMHRGGLHVYEVPVETWDQGLTVLHLGRAAGP